MLDNRIYNLLFMTIFDKYSIVCLEFVTLSSVSLRQSTHMNERIKKIMLIILLGAGSAFFLYNGFTLLFSEERPATLQQQSSDGN